MAKSKSKTAAPAGEGSAKKKVSKTPKKPAYASYLHKIMKQVHPQATISGKAMEVLNAMVEDVETRVTTRALELAKFSKKNTLSYKHVQAAVTQIMSGEMQQHGISEGTKAVNKYVAEKKDDGGENENGGEAAAENGDED